MFHYASKYVLDWMKRQPYVKEESLTDWLLYFVSEHSSNIYYRAFTRWEEAVNGSDWEWWVLTDGSMDYNAYRFRIQAKKLKEGDNYSLLSYSNKRGHQIELLINSAVHNNAYPLYAFYSTDSPTAAQQFVEFSSPLLQTIIWKCDECKNGVFISPAAKVYRELFDWPKHITTSEVVLNKSIKLSSLDYLLEGDSEETLRTLNKHYLKSDEFRRFCLHDSVIPKENGVDGIRHFGKGIPHYVRNLVQSRGEAFDYIEREYNLNDLSGVGIIDLTTNRHGQ